MQTRDKTKLFSKTVSPICDIEEGREKGSYTYVYSRITRETVPLNKAEGEKRVYLVPLDAVASDIDGIAAYLREYGLKPCQSAPQYLLGLMATTPESELPDTLRRRNLVAADNDPASVFRGSGGDRCFLCVDRGGGERRLSLVSLGGRWHADGGWVFLAESLDSSNAESLEPSYSLPLGPAFLRTFSNVPLGMRTDIIYTTDKRGPMSWHVVWLEVRADTELAKEILTFLKAENII